VSDNTIRVRVGLVLGLGLGIGLWLGIGFGLARITLRGITRLTVQCFPMEVCMQLAVAFFRRRQIEISQISQI